MKFESESEIKSESNKVKVKERKCQCDENQDDFGKRIWETTIKRQTVVCGGAIDPNFYDTCVC